MSKEDWDRRRAHLLRRSGRAPLVARWTIPPTTITAQPTDLCTELEHRMQLRLEELEKSVSSLTQQLESKDAEMAELKGSLAETNTDLNMPRAIKSALASSRCEQLEKQVEESRGSLEEESARTDSTVQSAEQHEDILQKVEQAQSLAEQVATLTKDKQGLTISLATLKQQVAGFEAQVNPLISGNKDLTDKVTSLQTEKEGLQKEVERWSVRCKEAQANQNNDGLAADLEKVKKLSMEGLRKAGQEHETLTARISELETEIAESMETERAESSEKLELCTTDKAAIQLRVEELEQSLSSLTQQLESKDVEMAELKAKSSSVHADTNTDLHRHDQQTNTDYAPTAITASGTPTAAVRPTSITPDAPPCMATVQPTTSIHISTSSSSSYAGNQPIQVSSSSVQNQAEADTPSLASHQRPETSNQRPETSHQRPGSSTFHSNRRSREDDDEQPGPSTKIAMVTSSAHIQHQEASCDGSEVSQSTPIFPSTSSHSAGSSHLSSQIPVTSSEVARSTSESNEAMPSILDTPHLDSMEPASLFWSVAEDAQPGQSMDFCHHPEASCDGSEVSQSNLSDILTSMEQDHDARTPPLSPRLPTAAELTVTDEFTYWGRTYLPPALPISQKVCKHCGVRKFCSGPLWKKHVRNCLEGLRSGAAFTCPECGKVFSRKDAMKRHCLSQHGIDLKLSRNR